MAAKADLSRFVHDGLPTVLWTPQPALHASSKHVGFDTSIVAFLLVEAAGRCACTAVLRRSAPYSVASR